MKPDPKQGEIPQAQEMPSAPAASAEAEKLRSLRLQSLGTLATGIAHDVNNALLPLIFSAEMLRTTPDEATREKLLGQILHNAQRVQAIMKQILLFVGRMEPGKFNVDSAKLVRDIVDLLRHSFPKNITISTKIPEGTWSFLGDETQISQVLMNLFINARDAMTESGGTLTVGLENVTADESVVARHPEARPGNYVVVTVSDTGKGIPAEILDKIFDPFFTTKQLGHGTGLGLSIVLGIVKAHGGFVGVYSEVGRGTKFSLFIPATLEVRPQVAMPEHEAPRANGELILVVDDEEGIRQLTKASLERAGYQVVTAEDGKQAMEAFFRHRGKICAVVTDMMMPVMDGSQLIRSLKKNDPSLPVLAMSGLIEDKAEEAKSSGASCLLQKPFSSDTLLKTLALFVRRTKG